MFNWRCRESFRLRDFFNPAWLLFSMPNGCILAECRYCREFGSLHPRHVDIYDKFIGHYCDDCLDWIEADAEHWRLYALMCMADSSKSHPLFVIVSDCGLGHAIADFITFFSYPADQP